MAADRLDPSSAGAGPARPAPPPGARRLMARLAGLPGRRAEALAVVDGAFGDVLAEQGSPLAVPMTVRSAGVALTVEREALAAALPAATGRLVLLVHGLMCTESAWSFPGGSGTNYGSLLARDHGVTPLFLRYNTGRHISTNGRELAALLRRLVAAWPVRVRELTLVGHSMGGLVIRSALHYVSATRSWRYPFGQGRRWRSRVRRVVLIGVPNTGAPLEVVANLVSSTLSALPVPATQLVGLGLDARSAGIKDLRFGAIIDEDWQGQPPDARTRPRPHEVAPLRRADYLVIAGTITRNPEHPITRMTGDALVTTPSAAGVLDPTTDARLFPGATVRVFPRVTHLALANRPEVYQAIDEWWPRPRLAGLRLRP